MADHEWVVAEYNLYEVTVYEYESGHWKERDTGLLNFFYDYPRATLACAWRGHPRPGDYKPAYYETERVGTDLYYWEAWHPPGQRIRYDEFWGYYDSETGEICGVADNAFLFYGEDRYHYSPY
jgi:hypothetical protein